MTDEALAGDAAASADSAPAPEAVIDDAGQTPNPAERTLKKEPEPEPEQKPKQRDLSEIIKDADAKAKAKAAEKDKPEAKTEPKADDKKAEAKPDKADKSDSGADKAGTDKAEPARAEQPRGEDGKFAAKDGQKAEPEAEAPKTEGETNHRDAPSRFSGEAKSDWAKTPGTVRGETHRMVDELEAGLKRYKADAEAYEPVRKYDDLAKQNGVKLSDMMGRYLAADQSLQKDLLGGLDHIARQYGHSLRQIAEHITGQSADEARAAQDKTIGELRAENARLKQENDTYQSEIADRGTKDALRIIDEFKANGHPRFEELRERMGRLMGAGIATDLEEAYAMADQLIPAKAAAEAGSNPAPEAGSNPASSTAAQTGAQTMTAQTGNGRKSVSGAPTPGYSPPTRRTASAPSIKEALQRASARAAS